MTADRFDVVVLGSGLAGLSAAWAASKGGARVAVLEAAEHTGGSSRLSAGMFWTAPSVAALRARIPEGDPELGAVVVGDFEDAVAELRSTGVRVAEEPQTDVMTYGIGYSFDVRAVLDRLSAAVLDAGGSVTTGVATHAIDRNGDGWVVTTGQREYRAPAVVLATGGFQGDRDGLRAALGPAADRLVHRSNPVSAGAGLALAERAGAARAGAFDSFYGHLMPSPVDRFTSAQFLPLSQYYSENAVLLGLHGRRFADETLGDEIVNQLLVRQPDSRGFLVFDDTVHRTRATREPFPGLGVLDRYRAGVEAGARHVDADTIEELAAGLAAFGVDEAEASVTLTDYAEAIAAGRRESRGVPIGASARPPIDPPFSAIEVQPSITFTFGGIRIDPDGAVLDAAGSSIPGLFAAGADIGGLSVLGYAGGLAPAYITGRRAGRSAARVTGRAEVSA